MGYKAPRLAMRANYNFMLTAAAVALLTGCTTSKEAATPSIKVIRARGEVQYSIDGTNWQPVKRGQRFTAGTTIRTGGNGVVDLLIGEAYPAPVPYDPYNYNSPTVTWVPRGDFENTVRVFGASELSIDRLSATRVGSWFDGRTEVCDIGMTLRSGNMFGNARVRRFPPTHAVKFGDRIIQVQGGKYGVVSNNIVCAIKGEATVSGGGTETMKIRALHEYDPATKTMTQMPEQPMPSDLVPIYGPQPGQPAKPIMMVQPTPTKK